MTEQVVSSLREALREGKSVAVARVVEVKGFSTLPVDEIVAVDSEGRQYGQLLGSRGAQALADAARRVFEHPGGRIQCLEISIHGAEVAQMGLACGGQAQVLLQPAALIPEQLWEALENRVPVALVTRVEGQAAGPAAMVVTRDGARYGELPGGLALAEEAVARLREGRAGVARVEDELGAALIDAWVPDPRLVVVGTGEMVGALEAQARLLGWELRHTNDPTELEQLLDWAGGTAALVVLSHDPHVDTPALAAGLARGAAYVGAMGSRGTQSRRLERLSASGVPEAELVRIHRPIGLNLGGRRAPEVALAIVAEILAVHHGRNGGSLKLTGGPIHG